MPRWRNGPPRVDEQLRVEAGRRTLMYYVYVLLSEKHKKTYVGITDNLDRRLKQHNEGYHPYTKRYVPWLIVHFEKIIDRPTARQREIYLKSSAGRKWMKKNIFGIHAEVAKW